MVTRTSESMLKGSVLGVILHDVCEEFRLEELRGILGARRTEPSFKHATPEYVRFENPPVVETLDPILLGSGESVEPQIKYYDYGVVSVLMKLPFEGGWEALADLAARWVPNSELEQHAEKVVRRRLERIAPAMVRPYSNWLGEDYYIFLLSEVADRPLGADLLRDHGSQIAQIIRGERAELAQAEKQDVLQSALSYYPRDLIVIGWNPSLIYDTPSGAEPSVQILEYVNSQLLEFRHYDELLTRELAAVYGSLKHRAGLLKRWQIWREASRLNTMTVEVTELVERASFITAGVLYWN